MRRPLSTAPRRLASLLTAAALALVAIVITGCPAEELTPPLAVCNPVLEALDPSSGPIEGGTEVVLSGLWVATELGERDVSVHLAGAQADVTGVFKGEGCTSCDACIADVLICAECERVCHGETGWTDAETGDWIEPMVCEQWVSFRTPEGLQPGPAEVQLSNLHGSGSGIDFEYEAP